MVKTTVYESWTGDDMVGMRSSEGKVMVSGDAGTLLKFLRYSAYETIRCCWDMDEFIAPLLRLLPVDILDRLSKFDDGLSYQGHELYYLPGRMFRVGKSRFYGVRDFWGAPTDDKPGVEAVQRMVGELLTALNNVGISNPRKLTSPPAVFEDSELGKNVYAGLPRGYDIPQDCYGMLEYAGKADGKDWVSNYVVGHFEEGQIFDYDISSAYPSIAAQLPDLRDLNYWKSKKMGERERRAVLGIVKGSFYLDPGAEYAHCSPIISVVHNELPGNPLGQLPEDCYSLDEVRFIEENRLGRFTMKDGYFADGDTDRFPLRSVMNDLYTKRSTSALTSSICKSIANSLIGKMIETKVSGEYGPLRNDLYHAIITSRTRVNVARFLISNQIRPDELVCVQTDGVRLTRDIQLPSAGMGSWSNKGSARTLVFSPYKVYSAESRPYRLTYSDIIGMIKEHPLSQTYSKTIKHRITMVQAIRQYNDLTRVGDVVDMADSVDLVTMETEQNRIYKKMPATGRALINNQYRSTPFVYGK